MPIINGKRYEMPSSGEVLGKTLIQESSSDEGRRAIIEQPGKFHRFDSIDPDKIYTKSDLTDVKGKPIKIIDIPDRTKGSSLQANTISIKRS